MNSLEHLRRMARYSRWMNEKVYAAAGGLSSDRLAEEGAAGPGAAAAIRSGAFGARPASSVLALLNQQVTTDILWLQRIAGEPGRWPALDPVLKLRQSSLPGQLLYTQLDRLSQFRHLLDQTVIRWINALTMDDLNVPVAWDEPPAGARRESLELVLDNLFSGQQFLFGQAAMRLGQFGLDIGDSSLLAMLQQSR